MLTRRPTGLGRDDDYQIFSNGKPIGRTYKAVNVAADPWVWFLTASGVRDRACKDE